MRQFDLIEVLENIDDRFIQEAETYKKVTKLNDKRFFITVAASLIVLIGVITLFIKFMPKSNPPGIVVTSDDSGYVSTVVETQTSTTPPGPTGAYAFEPVNDVQGTAFILVSTRVEGNTATVTFTNIDDETWVFGEYYRLEVLLEGQWYYVPYVTDYAVHDLAHELAPDQSITMTYDLSPFGELAPGDYRIAAGDLGNGTNIYYACFTKTDDGAFIGTDPTGYPSGYEEE